MSLILWAVPIAAFLMALVRLARQFHCSRSNRLIREQALMAKFSIAASTEAPALASPEPEVPELPGPVSGPSSSSEAAERDFGPLSRENLQRLCYKFRIRKISLLPSTSQDGAHAEANLQILVEFEPHARMNYPVFFRLRNELFVILGRRVDLVCRNSAEREGQREAFAQAQVLYAA